MRLVSIITATRNLIDAGRVDHFRQMFESVRCQSHGAIEHVFIDGASDDGTLDLIRGLIDAAASSGGIRYKLVSEPDSGIYNAFNKGLALAEGECIAFMNSDDFYTKPTAIAAMVGRLEADGSSFTCARAEIEAADRNHVFEPDLKDYRHRMPFCHQTMLCRKELFEVFGPFSERYATASDYEFIVKLLNAGVECSQIEDVLVYFRYSGASSDVDGSRRQMTQILSEHVYAGCALTLGDIRVLVDGGVSASLCINAFKTWMFRRGVADSVISMLVPLVLGRLISRMKACRRQMVSVRWDRRGKRFRLFGRDLLSR